MTIAVDDIKRAIKPLRFVFWGGLICLFDLSFTQTVNGEGWKFDILNDAVGMIMITWGVFVLSGIPVHSRYSSAMLYVKIVAALSILNALHGHFIYEVPPVLSFLLLLLGLASIIATVVFCIAMRWVCVEGGLQRAADSWKTTTILFVVIYLVPVGAFYAVAIVAAVVGESFRINLGLPGLILVLIFFIPIVHLFISTSRMRGEAEKATEESLDQEFPPTDVQTRQTGDQE